MTEGNFVDYVKVHVASGNGGKGSVHLHREKYITKGGPDGGDGGRGGHVILRGNNNLWALDTFKFRKHFKAGHGEHGSKNRSTGADGQDVYMDVPLGTVVRNGDTNEVLFEITENGEEKIVAEFIIDVDRLGGVKSVGIIEDARCHEAVVHPAQLGVRR